jgi:hypothetical protein
MQSLDGTVINTTGDAIAGASVSVTDYLTGSAVTLYEDDESTTQTNPMTSDSVGMWHCMVPPGIYDVTVTYGAFVVSRTKQTLIGSGTAVRQFFVGKHGKNTNNGRSYEQAFLTIGAAITAANLLTPASGSEVAIHVVDDGVYTENLTIAAHVRIFAPLATITGTHTVGDATILHVAKLINSSGSAITKATGSVTAGVVADVLESGATAITVDSGGELDVRISRLSGTVTNNGTMTGYYGDGAGQITLLESVEITDTLTVDTVDEHTADAGVTIDGALIKDKLFLGDNSIGEIYVADGSTAQTIATGATYAKLTGFATDGQGIDCTPAAASDKITITRAGIYVVHCEISASAGTANVTFSIAAFLDGVEQDQCHTHRKFAGSGDDGSCSFCGFVDVGTVPVDIDVRARHDAGGDVDLTPRYMNLNVMRVATT